MGNEDMKDQYFCDSCLVQIDDQSVVCPKCGAKTDNNPIQKVSKNFKKHLENSKSPGRDYAKISQLTFR